MAHPMRERGGNAGAVLVILLVLGVLLIGYLLFRNRLALSDERAAAQEVAPQPLSELGQSYETSEFSEDLAPSPSY